MIPSLPKGFFTLLFWFAGIGAVATLIGGGWLAYHLTRAVLFYVGAL
nr:MAG TPA: hypothetical protein [Caudoviricetes sp.]